MVEPTRQQLYLFHERRNECSNYQPFCAPMRTRTELDGIFIACFNEMCDILTFIFTEFRSHGCLCILCKKNYRNHCTPEHWYLSFETISLNSMSSKFSSPYSFMRKFLAHFTISLAAYRVEVLVLPVPE